MTRFWHIIFSDHLQKKKKKPRGYRVNITKAIEHLRRLNTKMLVGKFHIGGGILLIIVILILFHLRERWCM